MHVSLYLPWQLLNTVYTFAWWNDQKLKSIILTKLQEGNLGQKALFWPLRKIGSSSPPRTKKSILWIDKAKSNSQYITHCAENESGAKSLTEKAFIFARRTGNRYQFLDSYGRCPRISFNFGFTQDNASFRAPLQPKTPQYSVNTLFGGKNYQ